MKTEEIAVTNTTTEKVYICEDGKMFKNYRLAQEYEREIRLYGYSIRGYIPVIVQCIGAIIES